MPEGYYFAPKARLKTAGVLRGAVSPQSGPGQSPGGGPGGNPRKLCSSTVLRVLDWLKLICLRHVRSEHRNVLF